MLSSTPMHTSFNLGYPQTQYPFQTLRLSGLDSGAAGVVATVGSTAGMALGAYHGYKRTGRVWPAIGWSLLGGVFWPIVIPVIFVQGVGKRKAR